MISVYALADTRDQGGLTADAIGDIARLAVKAVSPESLGDRVTARRPTAGDTPDTNRRTQKCQCYSQCK